MKIEDVLTEMNFNCGVKLEEMPEIDLYMDQVIQLFEGKLSSIKRNDDEKILTKTMINNYAKGKLLLPIKNKKYSKEHLIMMSLIYNLKGALSISDIKKTLEPVINKYESEESYPIREVYKAFLEEGNEEIEEFKENVINKSKQINDKLKNEDIINGEFEKQFILLCSMVNMSNMYRRLSEKLIDNMFNDKSEK